MLAEVKRRGFAEDDRRFRRRLRGGRVPDGCQLVDREDLEDTVEACGRMLASLLTSAYRLDRHHRAAAVKRERVVARDAVIGSLLARDFSDESVFAYLKDQHPELVTTGRGKNARLVNPRTMMRNYRQRHG
jgi:hypothetical protein